MTIEHPWDGIIRFVCLNDTGARECGLGTRSNHVGRKLGSLVGLMTQGGDCVSSEPNQPTSFCTQCLEFDKRQRISFVIVLFI